MKKYSTLLAALIIAPVMLFSQSLSFSIGGGYCLPLATDFHDFNSTTIQNNGFPSYYTAYDQLASGSYGNGENIEGSIDWFSKKNIGFGLKFNALFSSRVLYSNNITYTNGLTADFNNTNTGFSYQFIPHINFKHDFRVVSPYLEMGMLIGITHVNEYYEAEASTGDVETSNVVFNGGIMLGFYSSLGVMFNVSKVVKVTLAVNCSAASYSPTKWLRNSYTYNGVDQLSTLPVNETQGTFVKQLDLTATQPANQPDQELKFSLPFSNVGFTAGVCFVIPAKEKEHPARHEKKLDDFHGF